MYARETNKSANTINQSSFKRELTWTLFTFYCRQPQTSVADFTIRKHRGDFLSGRPRIYSNNVGVSHFVIHTFEDLVLHSQKFTPIGPTRFKMPNLSPYKTLLLRISTWYHV